MVYFFSVAAPGSANDREAIKETGLFDLLDNLPPGFALIGDAAYDPSEKIVPMFYGIHKQDPECNNFNFYASQCRIRIEMAFGLMQMKWGILWRPMKVKLRNIKYLVVAIARLHNFVINERLENDEQIEEIGTDTNRVYNPTVTDDTVNEQLEQAKRNHLKGMSIVRDNMVERIAWLKLKRPKNNILRTNDEDE